MNDLNMACFMSAVRTKSFSATSKALGITQQAVSRNIKKLEDELGFALFMRNTQSIKLTKGGEVYYRWLTEFDQNLGWIELHLNGDASGESAAFRVAFCDWLGCPDYVRNALEQLKRDYQELRIEYWVMATQDVKEAVINGSVDIVFMPEPAAASCIMQMNDAFISNSFFKSSLYLSALPEFFREDGQPDLQALSELACITTPMGDNMDEFIQTEIKQMEVRMGLPNIRKFSVDNVGTVYTRLLCAQGYTLSPMNQMAQGQSALRSAPVGDRTVPVVGIWRKTRRMHWAELLLEYLEREEGYFVQQ